MFTLLGLARVFCVLLLLVALMVVFRFCGKMVLFCDELFVLCCLYLNWIWVRNSIVSSSLDSLLILLWWDWFDVMILVFSVY